MIGGSPVRGVVSAGTDNRYKRNIIGQVSLCPELCSAIDALEADGQSWPAGFGGGQEHAPAPTHNATYLHSMLQKNEDFEVADDKVDLLEAATALTITRLFPLLPTCTPITDPITLNAELRAQWAGSDKSVGQPTGMLTGTKTKGDVAASDTLIDLVSRAAIAGVLESSDAPCRVMSEELGRGYLPTVLGSPKRELRDVERVALGKVRLFMPADVLNYAVLFAFFGRLSSLLHGLWSYSTAWIRVGMPNVHGCFNTHMLMHATRAFSIAGDFSRFDQTLNTTLMECIVRVLCSKLPESFQWLARGAFWAWVVSITVAMFDGTLWRKFCGLASGTLITSDVGSIGHIVGITYCVLRCIQEFAPWRLNEVSVDDIDSFLTCSVYSDDGLYSFDEAPDFGFTRATFTAANIQRWYAEIGLVWTYEHDFAPFGSHVDFLGQIPISVDGVWVPVCKNPGKIAHGLRYTSNTGDALRSQFDAALLEFAYSDEWFAYVSAWAAKCGFNMRDQAHYQRYYRGTVGSRITPRV